jgi:hypothetical protein
MKGTLIKTEQGWMVEYFIDASSNIGGVGRYKKELFLHPSDHITNKTQRVDGKEVEFEIVKELEDINPLRITYKEYAKLINNTKEVGNDGFMFDAGSTYPPDVDKLCNDERKQNLIDIMNDDAKDGLYDVRKIVFPKDINGIVVKVGDKVQGIGSLKFQDGFEIDRTPVVTANIQNGKLYFGNLSAESFTLGFKIVESKMVEDDIKTTTSDLIDNAIWSLPFEERMKCWDLIEKLVEEGKEALYTEEQVMEAMLKVINDLVGRELSLAQLKESIIQSLKQLKKD